MTKSMDMAKFSMPMEISMKGTGKMVKGHNKEITNTPMAMFTVENGRMILKKDTEN